MSKMHEGYEYPEQHGKDSPENEAEMAIPGRQQSSPAPVFHREFIDPRAKATSNQAQIVADLERLYYSLRGPEGMLDKANYSRPFPPGPVRGGKQSDL